MATPLGTGLWFYCYPTAANPPSFVPGALSFLFDLQAKREPTSGLEPLTYNLITSDNSCVAGVCTGLQIPHI
jgi:hypothetical protein